MGEGSLARVGDVVRAVEASRVPAVPDAFIALLENSPLPSVVDGMFYTDPSVMLSRVETHGGMYFKLGSSEQGVAGRYLLSKAGEVFIQGPDGGQLRFVNSGLNFFLRFVSEWHGFVSDSVPLDSEGDVDEDAVIEKGMHLKEALELVDGAAFSDESTWWSNVFDEVELGVLGPL